MPDSFGFLSTYPPTQCGLATFTASLAAHLGEKGEVGVVQVVDEVLPEAHPEVVHQWATNDPRAAPAAAALNRFDVAIIQHEYGIFGGMDGDAVLDVLRRLRVPTVVVLHTVLTSPSPHQRAVLEGVVRGAAAVVVMTRTAERRLLEGYTVDPSRVVVIPHGAPTDWALAGDGTGKGEVPTILTWGLLGPGKGIEWAIEALATLRDLSPTPRYLVVGETHPRVLEQSGDRYRDELKARAAALGVGHLVTFHDQYLDQVSLRRLVVGADVVVLPYDSVDQVTSGVLIEAVACRRPVIATAFPHAIELLSGGAGTVVSQQDAAALAAALRQVLTDPAVAQAMVRAAESLAPDLTWRAVADRYRTLGRRLADSAVSDVA